MDKYRLVCPVCKSRYPPEYASACPQHDSLLHTEYAKRQFSPKKTPGLWRFIDWMPVEKPSNDAAGPVTYRSEGLARELGLTNLYISFNGYWPEKKALNTSATFKEYEAVVTLQRMKEYSIQHLVVASAGNTARAFLQVAQRAKVHVIAVVPQDSMTHLWSLNENQGNITIISVTRSDYFDAIEVANRLYKAAHFVSEGGAKNIGRRDGMASVVYDAASVIKDIPQHYFQAIGSGTGAIGALEGARRLAASGAFKNSAMRLHLSQNIPFAPIVSAYTRGSNIIDPKTDMHEKDTARVVASMLTNRRPPYTVPGGTYHALRESDGRVYGITNKDVARAQETFQHTEGMDVVPESGVAIASLERAITDGEVAKGESVLLNLTGGGINNLRRDQKVYYLKASYDIKKTVSDNELRSLFM